MRPNFTHYPPIPRATLPKLIVFVNLLLGGAKAPLLRMLLKMPQTINLVIDNRHEVELLKREFADQQFFHFSMGHGQTMWAMIPDHPAANSTTYGGYGARLKNSERAANHLSGTKDFQDFCQTFPDEILSQCGGAVELMELNVYGSIAGAANAGAGTVLVPKLLKPLLRLQCPIELTFHSLGPTTFLGLAPRARINAASALLSQVNFVLDQSPQFQLVAKRLHLHELPPFRDDVEQRTRYLLADAAIMNGTDMRNYLRLVLHNMTNDGECGNLVSREVDFMVGLDEETDIASRVAKNLRDQLQEQIELAQDDPQLVDHIHWDDVSTSWTRESLDDIAERFTDSDDDELLRAIQKPVADHRFQISAATAHGGDFLLEALSRDFSVTPTSFHDYLQRIKLLKTFRRSVTTDLNWVNQASAQLTTAIAGLSGQFRETHRRLMRRPMWRQRVIRQLLGLAADLRMQGDQFALRQAETEALHRALSAIDHELQHHESILTGMMAQLDEFVPRGSLQQIPCYVAVQDIAEVFPALLRMPRQTRSQRVQILCAAADQILPAGMAKIVHAPSDRLEQIAEQVVHGAYEVVGPPHGGHHRHHMDATIYALPAIDLNSRAKLPDLIRKLDPKAKVVIGDTVEFGATVARARLHSFSKVQELFDGLPGSDLLDAVNDPYALLNSPDGFAGIEKLGGRVEGDRIVFPG